MKNLLWILPNYTKTSALSSNKGFNSTADSIPSYKNSVTLAGLCFSAWFIKINPKQTFTLEYNSFNLSIK